MKGKSREQKGLKSWAKVFEVEGNKHPVTKRT
jgi:hypothetical protein